MSKAMPPEEAIEEQAHAAGYHIPGVYREKCRERAGRPGVAWGDLQPGEVVIAERVDRISQPPPDEAATGRDSPHQGARLAVPGVVDLSPTSRRLQPSLGKHKSRAAAEPASAFPI
ncbi:MAG: hypothetical protein E5X61_18740 [Mesorhizobium sp.]|nr:MAG: hypothetical protein E5X61_18740 [Mesorhizobium sp.]